MEPTFGMSDLARRWSIPQQALQALCREGVITSHRSGPVDSARGAHRVPASEVEHLDEVFADLRRRAEAYDARLRAREMAEIETEFGEGVGDE